MEKQITILVLLALASCCLAQVPFLGSCPKPPTMPDFDAEKYLGLWYEAERYFAVFEFAGKCVTANYSEGANGTVKVVNKLISTLTGSASQIEGVATIQPGESGKLSVRFPYVPVDGPYWVLKTDYENYSVVWSCNNFGIFNTRNVWILTRARFPGLEIMEKAYGVLDKNNISRAFFIRTDQVNCPSDYAS